MFQTIAMTATRHTSGCGFPILNAQTSYFSVWRTSLLSVRLYEFSGQSAESCQYPVLGGVAGKKLQEGEQIWAWQAQTSRDLDDAFTSSASLPKTGLVHKLMTFFWKQFSRNIVNSGTLAPFS